MRHDTILILEDDIDLRETVQDALEAEGFDVLATAHTDTVLEWTYDRHFDLYLFDVNVIGMNGFALLRALREAGDETPTIFLTSRRSTDSVIEGFDVGASDYVKKPFEMEELLARIMRYLRRKSRRIIAEETVYYPRKLEVIRRNTRCVLTDKEARILEYFLDHPNRIISKDEIIQTVYGDEYITDTTLRGYISRIKHAIGSERLRNIRGRGYLYETV